MVSADGVRLVANYIEEKPARQAWFQVREWIAIRFLDELERTLHAELGGGCETTNPRGRVFSRYDIHISKREWEDRHFIALYPEHGEGRDFIWVC